ncbi:toll/interleukin-1 receptor domain-containing protein [Novosphingobium fluoreni]|uniref:toll/interleukin-1 receptor domain-containing protein n=1 Tax=Novosphingobium fluoreni TaxID=1391222 RepID=UPI003DA1B6B1
MKAKWSKPTSTVFYTSVEAKALEPIRDTVERRSELPDLRELFLCHAWADRLDDATRLYNLLEARNVSVWFSEKDIPLGSSFLREIDKGLAKSRVGIVLVTPALLSRLPTGGVADRELSALLATDQLVPIVHNTTYDALRMVSPLLASRNGLSTEEDTLDIVADKLAELVKTQ